MITMDNLTLRRGDADVLRRVSLTIRAGSVTAILGRSGAGKTSLICALNGLISARSGEISVGGIGRLDTARALREHRRRTATIFQDHALIDRLSAIENVLLGLADARHPLSLLPWPGAMRQRAAIALDEVGLLDRAMARTSELSGGERQRVGVARALVRRPSLLLGDEPFSAADPPLVHQLSGIFRRAVRQTGLTVVIVLHQVEIALVLADQVIGLADGRIVFDGTSEKCGKAALSRIFGASQQSGDEPVGGSHFWETPACLAS
jgi:phosphonate transport system ATP-binding protein